MEKVLKALQWETLLIYLDGVIVYSKTSSEQKDRQESVFERLRVTIMIELTNVKKEPVREVNKRKLSKK
jgi:hypothetical protein